MKTQPLVSIIIPTYNRAHLIGETLDSVLAQTYQNWECIVVDDGSTDNTYELLKLYANNDSRFKCFKREDDYYKGANSCRHLGYLKSQGDYINWFDSDDLMAPIHIAEKVEKIIKDNFDFVVCEVARFKDSNLQDLMFVSYNYEAKQELVNQFVGDLKLFTSGPLWSRIFLERNLMYYKPNPNEKNDSVLNDWAFGLLALLNSSNFFFIKKPLIFYRFHEDSISANRLRLDTHAYLNEFRIRKHFYNLVKSEIGKNGKIERFYVERNLKILRVLLRKKEKSYPVLKVVLLSESLSIVSKINICFFYTTTVLFGRGVDKLKIH